MRSAFSLKGKGVTPRLSTSPSLLIVISFNFVYLLISYVFGTIAFLISWTITHTQSAGRLLSSPGFLCSLYAFDLCLLFTK